MVVICAGTTGYNLTMDARYLWMHQKRVQGSHFAHLYHASQANQLVIDRRIDPAMSEVFAWERIPDAHEKTCLPLDWSPRLSSRVPTRSFRTSPTRSSSSRAPSRLSRREADRSDHNGTGKGAAFPAAPSPLIESRS
jgi:hypothetical protein